MWRNIVITKKNLNAFWIISRMNLRIFAVAFLLLIAPAEGL